MSNVLRMILKDIPALEGTPVIDGAVVELDTTKKYIFLFARETPMESLEHAAHVLSKLLGPNRASIMLDDGVRILELVPEGDSDAD